MYTHRKFKGKINRKERKSIYIRIKNSWRSRFPVDSKIIKITIVGHNFSKNPKWPENEIIMDFNNRENIVRYGVMNVRIF